MPLAPVFLPLTTPLDPAEEPPGSIDPLGTLAEAERLAEVLLPGLTARMWRARLLTFAAVTARVADRALRDLEGKEDARLDARLAFERLAVSAIVRLAQKNPSQNRPARIRLPGSKMAETALAANEPVTRHNFLKGQAVNGPYGVMSRLALQLGLIDEDGGLGSTGPALLLAWATDQDLGGVLDEEQSHGRGAVWVEDAARQTALCLTQRRWPVSNSVYWDRWADYLRLDRVGPAERRVIVELLDGDPIRRRVLAILRQRAGIFAHHAEKGRGVVEREMMLAVSTALGGDPTDRVIDAVCFAAFVYETAAVWMQQGFDAILWGLKQLGGQATPDALLASAVVRSSLKRVCAGLKCGLRSLHTAVARLQERSELSTEELIGPIHRLREDAAAGAPSPADMLNLLLLRHERVQRQKRKGPWIDRDKRWTLLPGFGLGGELPPEYGPTFIHPFRIVNAYALLSELGEVSLELSDGED
jgi:hypothetical protein